MRADECDEFAGRDDFGFLPELWEMALIAGDQIVRGELAGGRALIPRNDFLASPFALMPSSGDSRGWPILAGFARVGVFLFAG
jgi:hypothetical protein